MCKRHAGALVLGHVTHATSFSHILQLDCPPEISFVKFTVVLLFICLSVPWQRRVDFCCENARVCGVF
jgi:hypothetical protein